VVFLGAVTTAANQTCESIAPDGTRYALPDAECSAKEAEALGKWAVEAARPVVVVQGVGFVGFAMAVAVAAARDDDGEPRFSVIGVDLPLPATFWKSCHANAGRLPVETTDEKLARAQRQAVEDVGNLRFSWVEDAYALADIVVVDVNLDVDKKADGSFDVNLGGFERAIRTVGRRVRADALVLVESTVPPGTCARIIEPALREEIQRRGLGDGDYRPLLAHSYERVMPGPNYLDSITSIWRVFSGNTPESAERARAFLSHVVDTERFPLSELENTTSSEMAKLLENSYRTINIALVHEWTRFAEAAGVDLFAAIEAIRVRRGTHDNLRYPGFGVGGYCLTKDALLADWAARNNFGMSEGLPVAREAVRINDAMPLHTTDLLRSLLGGFSGKRVLILGVSYLGGVGDTRATPTATLVARLEEEGGSPVLCDPLVGRWEERPDLAIATTPFEVEGPVDAVVFATPHEEFKGLDPDGLVDHLGPDLAIVDAQGMVSDAEVAHYQRRGCQVRAVGRGNVR
jgi:nucleotide sugar dehydrogenase